MSLYGAGLTRYIRAFVNNKRDAEELMIDTFAELAVDTKYRERSSLKTYLYAIGRNIALRHVKKFGRKNQISLDDLTEGAEYLPNLPELDFIKEDDRARLRAAMLSLKQEYREVLHLIYFENMGYADAGASLFFFRQSLRVLKHYLVSKKLNAAGGKP